MKKQNSNRPQSYSKLTMMAKIASINSRRRTGDVTRVSERTGYSVAHVSDVLNGHYINEQIINNAYDMTRGRIQNHNYVA